jgi:hypothetical protein
VLWPRSKMMRFWVTLRLLDNKSVTLSVLWL